MENVHTLRLFDSHILKIQNVNKVTSYDIFAQCIAYRLMVDGVVSTRQLSFAGFGEIQICGEVKTPSIIVAEIHLNIFSHKMTTNDEME